MKMGRFSFKSVACLHFVEHHNAGTFFVGLVVQIALENANRRVSLAFLEDEVLQPSRECRQGWQWYARAPHEVVLTP